MKKEYISNNREETIQIAKNFMDTIQTGCIITLEGDLGVGKTTFTKGFGLSLGIEDPIVSPTFTLLRQYEGRLKLNHIDAYRLENMNSDTLGLYDLMDEDAVVVIEWSNFISEDISADYHIKLEHLEDDKRLITIIKEV
ncbi:MAG: tRNA (adenosine(37)-N6)-threonylcarbamoyltransferase complex ATPase subunit type 1 TsaE [Erysipelothrix sp.]|nr:tRNA (adenosine(37)-N6)-threonylcarbamoyltransferase complex ATPase subunit type 1 TsaE [Erysipelothrix sp.]